MSRWPTNDSELPRRLPWLLVFRAAFATALLALAVFADWRSLPITKISSLLYGVILGNYLAVIGMGILLRRHAPVAAVAGVYLALSLASACMLVQATGVIDSAFAFLYLLVVLDSAIIGGRGLAIALAAACSLAYGAQLVLQVYGILPAGHVVVSADWEFVASGVINLSAFYLTAFLAGHLAELLRRARVAVSQATASLVRAQALHAAMLDALPVGVLAVDNQLVVRAANPSAAHIGGMGGVCVGQALPEPLRAALPPAGGPCVVRLAVNGQERVLGLVRSEPVTLGEATTSHTGDTAGANQPLTVVVIEDRTELTQLEEKLVAQERLASLGELAAAIAHEIRNPLAAISGSLELLLADDAEVATTRPLRDIVLREVDRLDRLVEDFLQFARPPPIELEQVDVAALTRDVCEVLRGDQAVTGRTISLSAPERLETRIDAARFRQVLWNLLRNAIDASPRDGGIELFLGSRPHAKNPGCDLVLEIRDHGAGVDPRVRPHLFEPFRTTKPSGTGLGLAVVHRIVSSHGGKVELVDAAGGGTVARVLLPG